MLSAAQHLSVHRAGDPSPGSGWPRAQFIRIWYQLSAAPLLERDMPVGQ